MKQKSQITEALVLKRSNTGEADRIVTLLTKDQGKIACIAKGVRKITSSKRAHLEPGNLIKVFLISSQSMPLLTQATVIEDCAVIRSSLPKVRQLMQVLEMLDTLCVEGEGEEEVFEQAREIRALIVQEQPTPGVIRHKLDELVGLLGYQQPDVVRYPNFMEYVSEVADKKMRAWDYLKVKS